MASFGWKRKVGEKVSKSVVQHFEAEAERAVNEDAPEKESVDWLHAIKRRRGILLEDCADKSKRLKDEGAHLAEQGRWGMLCKVSVAGVYTHLVNALATCSHIENILCGGVYISNFFDVDVHWLIMSVD